MQKALTSLMLLALLVVVYTNPALPGICFVDAHVDPVYRSFLQSEADLSELNMEAWAKLKYPSASADEMLNILKSLSKELAPGAVLKFDSTKDQGLQKMTLEGELDPNSYFYAAVQTIDGLQREQETYLLVNLTERGSADNLVNWRQQVKDAFKALKVKPQVAVYLTGELGSKLSQHEEEQLALDMFRKVSALKVEGISQPDLLSFSGYTPVIEDSLQVNKRKLNLNVAMTYDEIKEKTIVHVGSPLLNGEY